MLLQNKTAVIYGAAGAIGSAVANTFAREGATVFLTGRTLSSLQNVAGSIIKAGGVAEAHKVDALNQQQVEAHLQTIIDKKGSIDISFNLMSLQDIHGSLLINMQNKDFVLPVNTAMQGHFNTATAAIRQMTTQKSGVILALTANAARKPYTLTGGFGVACAAIEALCRQLAAEAGEHGIRVVCLRSAGSPDTPGVSEAFDAHAKEMGISREKFEKDFAAVTMLKRLPLVKEIAEAAVLMASDKSGAITAEVLNLTCGELAD